MLQLGEYVRHHAVQIEKIQPPVEVKAFDEEDFERDALIASKKLNSINYEKNTEQIENKKLFDFLIKMLKEKKSDHIVAQIFENDNSDDGNIRRFIVKHKNCPSSVFEKFKKIQTKKDANNFIWRKASENTNIPASVFEPFCDFLFEYNCPGTLGNVLEKIDISKSFLEKICALASNENNPKNSIESSDCVLLKNVALQILMNKFPEEFGETLEKSPQSAEVVSNSSAELVEPIEFNRINRTC